MEKEEEEEANKKKCVYNGEMTRGGYDEGRGWEVKKK